MNISRTILAATLAASCAFAANAAGASDQAKPAGGAKKALLVVSFGTSFEDNLKLTIEATEQRLAAAFPGYEVRRAFTSTIVIKVLKKKGIEVDTVDEALAKLKAEGFTELVVQPLHLIPGEEFHQLVQNLAPYRAAFPRLAVGAPLFSEPAGYPDAIAAIAAANPPVGPGEAVVYMGHGTHHPANSAYALIQLIAEKQGHPIYVGTVEGYPDLDWVIDRLEKDGIKKVTLIPLMLVAGDHANNDMAGDEDDSWKSILKAKGFEVAVLLRGLGSVPAVQKIYVEHAKAAIEALDGEKAKH